MLCFAFHILSHDGFAADEFQGVLIQPGLRARTSAPIPAEVRFKWEGTRILEGRLEMQFHEGNQVLGRYRSGEMALTTGEQRFRMLLPPPRAPYSDSQIGVRLNFVTDRQVLDLGPSSLFVPTGTERSLVVGWCDSRVSNQHSFGLPQSLLFERMRPETSEPSGRSLTTSLVRLSPEDLPLRPLGWIPFDVVVLTAEAFKETREGQLQALARWVKGGGSVCVFVSAQLQPRQIRFLNELAASASAPAFRFDSEGNLLSETETISRLRSGIGRSVIVAGSFESEPGLNSADWRRAVTFLWKLRAIQARAVVESGHWKADRQSPEAGYRSRRYPSPGYSEFQHYGFQPSELGPQLTHELMPRSVRLIPLTALLVTLGLFLLVVGPGDYYLLGLLRRRRYTWVLFPLTSIGFMIVTVLMANHYLGQRDERRSLIVVDLGNDGSALRWSRYQLLFAARDKQAVTELKDALWAPLDFRDVSGRYTLDYMREERERVSNPLYEGVLPVQYRTSETIRQWRPEMSRTFSFEAPPIPLPADWRAVEEAWPNLNAIRARLSAKERFTGDVCSIARVDSVRHELISMDADSPGILPLAILQELCVGESAGLLSVVSRIAPTGGGNFEDAGGMDIDADEAALVIVTRAGDDIVLFRRFFHGN